MTPGRSPLHGCLWGIVFGLLGWCLLVAVVWWLRY
jgi:hypothetical protein